MEFMYRLHSQTDFLIKDKNLLWSFYFFAMQITIYKKIATATKLALIIDIFYFF